MLPVAKQKPVELGADDGIGLDSMDDTATSQSSAIDEDDGRTFTL